MSAETLAFVDSEGRGDSAQEGNELRVDIGQLREYFLSETDVLNSLPPDALELLRNGMIAELDRRWQAEQERAIDDSPLSKVEMDEYLGSLETSYRNQATELLDEWARSNGINDTDDALRRIKARQDLGDRSYYLDSEKDSSTGAQRIREIAAHDFAEASTGASAAARLREIISHTAGDEVVGEMRRAADEDYTRYVDTANDSDRYDSSYEKENPAIVSLDGAFRYGAYIMRGIAMQAIVAQLEDPVAVRRKALESSK
jgi:hypothetical protein